MGTYCIKEYNITPALRLTADRGRATRPKHSTLKLTRDAQASYRTVSAWLGE